jgi:hypothetical protein
MQGRVHDGPPTKAFGLEGPRLAGGVSGALLSRLLSVNIRSMAGRPEPDPDLDPFRDGIALHSAGGERDRGIPGQDCGGV